MPDDFGKIEELILKRIEQEKDSKPNTETKSPLPTYAAVIAATL